MPDNLDVLSHYRLVNPSLRDPGEWARLFESHKSLYHERLHLPPRLFRGAKVLDIGCGTGEFTAMYGAWGAFVDGVDGNSTAVERVRSVFAAQGIEAQLGEVHVAELSQWSPREASYDFVICQGVLHHMTDPEKVFRRIAAGVAPNGFLVLSVNPSPGYEIRQAMRQRIQAATTDLNEAVRLAKEWFPSYLERATQRGRRTVEQVVSDNFLVPINHMIPIVEILRWFHEANLRFYRSWPVVEAMRIDPPSEPLPDWTAPELRDLLGKQAERWFDDDQAVRKYDGVGAWWAVGCRKQEGCLA